jgi:hypothetical protein
MAKTYITFCGQSEWATFNSLWAVIRRKGFLPDYVVIVSFEADMGRAMSSRKRIADLLATYGLAMEPTVKTVEDSSVAGTRAAFQKLFGEIIGSSSEAVLDVTNGRKMMVMSALSAPDARRLNHIYYLYIDTLEDADHPYMCIPMNRQQVHDFAEGRAMNG